MATRNPPIQEIKFRRSGVPHRIDETLGRTGLLFPWLNFDPFSRLDHHKPCRRSRQLCCSRHLPPDGHLGIDNLDFLQPGTQSDYHQRHKYQGPATQPNLSTMERTHTGVSNLLTAFLPNTSRQMGLSVSLFIYRQFTSSLKPTVSPQPAGDGHPTNFRNR